MMKVCLLLVTVACLAGALRAQNCGINGGYCSGTCVTVAAGNTVGGFVNGNTGCESAVAQASGLANVNTISVGQVLCIPAGCYANSGYTGSTSAYYGYNGYSGACGNYACSYGTCYTVQSGNTVSGIVGGSQSCINSVASANNINPNSIWAGQTLCIPYGCNTYAAAANYYSPSNYYNGGNNGVGCSGTVVTVQSGNTVSGLVGGNQACINAVGTANNINPSSIWAGQQLCIPAGCYGSYTGTSCSVGATHTIVSGDTCQAIANAYGITLAQLYACNSWINNPSCNNLYVGQSIVV
jgi:LysM repeat protein